MSAPSANTNHPWIRRLRKALLLALIPGLAIGVFALYLVANHNFHVVAPGILYRSGQMSGAALAKSIQEHGIKSILNLRGAGNGQDWYTAEITVAQQFGVEHFDYPLSATRELNAQEMDDILDTIERAPKPMLIHCKSGSDRTGLIGALYLYSVKGEPANKAGRQLATLYGHLPFLFWSGTIAMDRSYWRYVGTHDQPARNAVKAASLAQDPASAPGAFLARGQAQ